MIIGNSWCEMEQYRKISHNCKINVSNEQKNTPLEQKFVNNLTDQRSLLKATISLFCRWPNAAIEAAHYRGKLIVLFTITVLQKDESICDCFYVHLVKGRRSGRGFHVRNWPTNFVRHEIIILTTSAFFFQYFNYIPWIYLSLHGSDSNALAINVLNSRQ